MSDNHYRQPYLPPSPNAAAHHHHPHMPNGVPGPPGQVAGQYMAMPTQPPYASVRPQSNSFTLNPNAAPFHPSYASYRQDVVPPYMEMPRVYQDGYCAPNAYSYRIPPHQQVYLKDLDSRQKFPELTTQIPPDAAPHYRQTYMDSSSLEPDDATLNVVNMYDANSRVPYSPNLVQKMVYSRNEQQLQEIAVGLEQLINDPGESALWSSAIKDRLCDRNFSPETLPVLIEMIIQMTLLSSAPERASYEMSRLCAFLSREVEMFKEELVVATLVTFCTTQQSNMNRDQCRTLLQFVADIYEKFDSKTSSKMKELRQIMYDQIKKFFSGTLDDAIVKFIVQVLKLTGRHLDSDDEGKTMMNEFLTMLNAIAVAHPSISAPVKTQIHNLYALRDNGWGMRSHSAAALEDKSVTNAGHEANFGMTPSSSFNYGSNDGHPLLSEEESAFIDENIRKLNTSDSATDDNDADEYERQYDEFLKTVEAKEAEREARDIAYLERSINGISLNGTDNRGSEVEGNGDPPKQR